MISSNSYNKEYLQSRGLFYNEYEGQAFRPLTFSERKVNWVGLRGTIRTIWWDLKSAVAKYIPIIAQWKFTLKDYNDMVDAVTSIQKDAFNYGRQTASSEMSVATKQTNQKVFDAMRKQNEILIGKMIQDINKKLGRFTDEGIISQFMGWLQTLFVSWAINLGRETVYEENPGLIYALQYSAILDGRTTEICRELDGMIVKDMSPQQKQYQPPNHRWCRSVRVEILKDEIYKPKLSVSIPDVTLDWKIDFQWYLDNVAKKVKKV